MGIFWILRVFNVFLGISIIMSWIPPLNEYMFFRGIRKVSDWFLRPFRGVLVFGPIDFTPMIGITIFQFIISTMTYLPL